MAGSARRWTASTGQLVDPLDVELRGRDSSGLPITWLDELRALIAGIDAPVWATGGTSAALNHLDGFHLRPPFFLVLERGRNVTRVGHVIQTMTSIPPIDREEYAGIPTLSPTRTLLVLAATEPPQRLTAALDGALRDGKTTEDFLHRRIGELRRSGRPGITAMLSVLAGSEVTRGGQSWLERRFLELVAAAGLPRPRTQQVLGRRRHVLIRVDFQFANTPIVVEVLGYEAHRSRTQLIADTERMNRLQLLGYQVLQFTYSHVVDDPDEVIATLGNALRPHLARPVWTPATA